MHVPPNVAVGPAVDRLSFRYDARGQLVEATVHDAGATPLSRIGYTYDPFGNLTSETLDPSPGTNPSYAKTTSYTWLWVERGTPDGSGPHANRLAGMTYPSGRQFDFAYGNTDSPDDLVSRITGIDASPASRVVSYTRTGGGRTVHKAWGSPFKVGLDLATNTAGQEPGLDRFGRLCNLRFDDPFTGTLRQQFRYGYDAAGNRLYARITQPGHDNDRSYLYRYDPLHRLAVAERGKLSGNSDVLDQAATRVGQAWSMDVLGNWVGTDAEGLTQYVPDAAPGLSGEAATATESHITDSANRMRRRVLDADGAGSGGTTIVNHANDAAGNLLLTAAHFFTYDPWNRAVEVREKGTLSGNLLNDTLTGTPGALLTRIEYDALGRRIAESVSSDANAGPTDYFYYDGNRIIEHHTAPSGNPPPPPPPQEYSLRLDGAPPGGSVTRVPHHGVAHRFSGGGVESDGRVAHRFSGGGVDSDGAAADDVMYTAVADGGADTAWGDDWDTAGTEPRPSGSGQVAAGQRRIAHFSGGGDAASTSVTNTAANGARPTLAAGIVDAAPGAAATPRPDASPRDAASLASVPSSGTILPTHVRRPGDDQPPPPPPIAPQPGARLYVYGVDDFSEIVAFYDDPATPGSPPWFVVQDANSNVTGVFDANGTLVEQYAYTPYGETLAMENGSGTPLPAGTQPALSLAFQGMWRHPTLGLYFSTSGRLYSPALGRWMQRDPKGSALLNTDIMRWHARTMNDTPTLEPDGQYIDGLNPFGFVRCNPAVASDATGLSVDDIGYGSELLLDRNWDDIYDSVKGNGFAYLGVQGAATWGAAWGGNIASLPDFAIRSAELAEGVSDFADYYADQVIWLPVNVLLEGVGQFAHAAAAAAHAAEGAGDAISTASNLNRVGNAADAARDGFHGSYLAASALGAQGKVRRIRNLHLAGRRHPATGIPFDKDGFPDFGSVAVKTVTIQQTGNRLVDAGRANKRAGLTSTPNGYVWHHHQDGRRMLLVPKRTHQLTGHTGGVGLSRSRGRR